MWPKHWISGMGDVQKELHRWKGADGQAWGYSVSHSQLLIRIFREQENKRSRTSLYLYLKDCYRVSFNDSWRDVDIQIQEEPGKFGPEFIIADSDRLFVHCGVHPFSAESPNFVRFESTDM